MAAALLGPLGCDGGEQASNEEACEVYNAHMTALPCIEPTEWTSRVIDCAMTDFDDAPDYTPYFECLTSAYRCDWVTIEKDDKDEQVFALISDDVNKCNGYKPEENQTAR